MAPSQTAVAVHPRHLTGPAFGIGQLLVGRQLTGGLPLTRRDRHPTVAHRDLCPLSLLAHFELGAQHPHLPPRRLYYKRVTGVRDLEECSAMQQPHMALPLLEIDSNGTARIQRHLRLVSQRHLANGVCAAEIGLQVLQPVSRMPAPRNAHGQHQTRRYGQCPGAPPARRNWRLGHGIQVSLQVCVFFLGQACRGSRTLLPQRLGLGIGFTVPGVGQQPALERRTVRYLRLLVDPGQPTQCCLRRVGGGQV
ncbi:hypothetical protein D3C81_1563540 [compost metagenome]